MATQVAPRRDQGSLWSRLGGAGKSIVVAVVALVLGLFLVQALASAPGGKLGGLNGAAIARSLTETIPPTIGVIIVAGLLMLVTYLFFTRVVHSKNALAYTLLMPSAAGLLLLVVWPFFYDILIAFSNLSLRTLLKPSYGIQYGIDNFARVFNDRLLQTRDSTFLTLFIRTVIWTIVNVAITVTCGMGLALLLNRPLPGRGIYRTLLIVPWAIPQVISATAWRNEFNSQYGFINLMLRTVGLQPVNWVQDPSWAFASAIIVNIWLGIPFMMIVILGGLQSISPEFYEAAEIDGASGWNRFIRVTLPLLRPVLSPAITLGIILTFNQLNVIFLVTEGGPSETTNILVSALYYAAFSFSRFGFAAAFSLVIFAILFVIAAIFMRVSGGLQSIYD
jgi:arabinogalactan oligomer / maltooligosaccharide transport system permease protein